MKSFGTSSLQLTSVSQQVGSLGQINTRSITILVSHTWFFFFMLLACDALYEHWDASFYPGVCYVLCYGFKSLVFVSCRLSASRFEFLLIPCFILKVISFNFLSDFTFPLFILINFTLFLVNFPLLIYMSRSPLMSASMSVCLCFCLAC